MFFIWCFLITILCYCQRKSLQTSFTKDNPRTQTKNNIGRSPRDAGDAPEGLGEHDSQIEKDNRSQGQTF